MVLVDQEEVVEIPADLLAGIQGGIDIEIPALGESREHAGQDVGLDLLRHVVFRADAPLLLRGPGDLLGVGIDALGHFGKGIAQHLEFVLMPEFWLGHAAVLIGFHHLRKLADGLRHISLQDLDHQQQNEKHKQ